MSIVFSKLSFSRFNLFVGQESRVWDFRYHFFVNTVYDVIFFCYIFLKGYYFFICAFLCSVAKTIFSCYSFVCCVVFYFILFIVCRLFLFWDEWHTKVFFHLRVSSRGTWFFWCYRKFLFNDFWQLRSE